MRYVLPLFLVMTLMAGCDSGPTVDPEVSVTDLVVGDGDLIEAGQTIMVSYEGRLENGSVLETSADRDKPFVFTLGVGQVLEGWELGMPGMREGGTRQIIIPPELAFGNDGLCLQDGSCPVPPGATLIFDVTVERIVDTTIIEDLEEGSGDIATEGSRVAVEYLGELVDGTVFDTSANQGQPFEFQLGVDSIIDGFEIGVTGMSVGGRRFLIIPPHEGYGPQGTGGVIPAYATLFFTIELVSVTDG